MAESIGVEAAGSPADARDLSSTSSRGTRVLGICTLVSAVALAAYGLKFSGADTELDQTVRIMYIHVPTVVIAYLCMMVNAVCSVIYLFRRTAFPDLMAAAAAEIGLVFLGLTLVTGMLWGRPTWGTYWSWGDPRLTTTALLFLMSLGYVTVRNIPAAIEARGTRSAVIGIVSALLIYPVHMSVTWWASLHQGATVIGGATGNVRDKQEFTLYLGFLTFMLLAAWLGIHRFRVAWLADQAAGTELDEALAERRAESGAPAEVSA